MAGEPDGDCYALFFHEVLLLFLMNYGKHYDALMERAKRRSKPEGYTERHHVNPRCLGGDDSPGNIVILTAEEHFLAHQLLVKMHPGHVGLMWAASAMCGGSANQRRSNKLYGWLRKRFAAAQAVAQSGRKYSAESREKMSRAKRGKKRGPHTAETRAKIAAASGSRRHSEETKRAISAKKRGVPVGPMSDERKNKHAEAMRRAALTRDQSFMQTDDYRKARSEQMKRVWAARRAAASKG